MTESERPTVSGVRIVNAIPSVEPDLEADQFPFEITEEFIQALRAGKYIEVRLGSMDTNEYQAYLYLSSKAEVNHD